MDKEPDVQNIPAYLQSMLESQYSSKDVRRILQGMKEQRPVTLRVNTLKSSPEEIMRELGEAGISYRQTAWSPDALILSGVREAAMQKLPCYTEGKIYLQSLSSMLPVLALAPRPDSDILDMTAAPGGKTTQIAALTGGKAHITACELHAPRAERLKFNLERQGASNVHVMRTDARHLDEFFKFDQVLLDAPCSGSGTVLLSDEQVDSRLTSALVRKTTAAQRALLARALTVLKPGCTMVYSTCSIFAEENEKIVQGALAKGLCEVVPFEVKGLDDVPRLPTALEGALSVCPTQLYEGFFVVKLRRCR